MTHNCVIRDSNLSINHKLDVDWEIKNFSKIHISRDCMHSPAFFGANKKLYISMFPFEESKHVTQWISLRVCEIDSGMVFPGSFTLGIKRPDGSVFRSFTIGKASEQGICRRSVILEQSELMLSLSSNDTLTVFCTLSFEDEQQECGDKKCDILPPVSESLRTLATNFGDLLKNGLDTDVKIKVKHREFMAHRIVLSARSIVFAFMFQHDMREKNSGVIKIIDCDPDCFQDFLTYFYTADVGLISSENALELFKMAHKYCLIDLQNECCKFFLRQLDVRTICITLQLASMYEEEFLLKGATKFFIRHWKKIVIKAQWQNFVIDSPLLANKLIVKLAESKRRF